MLGIEDIEQTGIGREQMVNNTNVVRTYKSALMGIPEEE